MNFCKISDGFAAQGTEGLTGACVFEPPPCAARPMAAAAPPATATTMRAVWDECAAASSGAAGRPAGFGCATVKPTLRGVVLPASLKMADPCTSLKRATSSRCATSTFVNSDPRATVIGPTLTFQGACAANVREPSCNWIVWDCQVREDCGPSVVVAPLAMTLADE